MQRNSTVNKKNQRVVEDEFDEFGGVELEEVQKHTVEEEEESKKPFQIDFEDEGVDF